MRSMLIIFSLLMGNIACAHSAHNNHKVPEVAYLKFSSGFSASTEWQAGPEVGKESILRIQWQDQSGQASAFDNSFDVVLWMPSMNHGSAPTKVNQVVDENGKVVTGLFEVSNIFFTMAGDWQVNIVLTDASGKEEVKSLDLMLAGGQSGHHHGHH